MGYDIPVGDVEKYQKWTGYFLIDIRIIFIITYVYISVVNLISTTANNEVNQDIENLVTLNVTSRPEHTNVVVNYIDDAVLWNCREQSLTSNYYITLYLMLFVVFTGTLTFYFASKIFALWSITSLGSLTDLWHMGLVEHFKKLMEISSCSSDDAVRLAKCYRDLLSEEIPKDIYKEVKTLPTVKARKLIPYWSLAMLVSAMIGAALSYDLHPLSCIYGVTEDYINYDNMTQTVELRFPASAITYQRLGVFITSLLFIVIILLALGFYQLTREIVKKMEMEVKGKKLIVIRESYV